MPRFKVMATEYIYKDSYVDAKDEEEAVQISENSNNFTTVGTNFEIHATENVTGSIYDGSCYKKAEDKSEDGGLNRQKFYDSLWQLVKDTNINFEEVLDDGENGVVVRFTGEKQ